MSKKKISETVEDVEVTEVIEQTDETVEEVKNDAEKSAETAGFCVYIGPSIIGVMQKGSIFKGTKIEVLNEIKYALDKYPSIADFIVDGNELAQKKIEATTHGNLLYKKYCRLAKGKN